MSTNILQKADRVTSQDRQDSYGHPLDNWTLTANLVNALFADKLKEAFTAEDMMLFMNQVKVARERHKPSEDNKLDIAGYARCKEMIEQERERREAHDMLYEMATTPLDYPILSADDRAELAAFTKQTPR
jgi:hypothetical protein